MLIPSRAVRALALASIALLGCAGSQHHGRRHHRERVVVLDVSLGGVALFADERAAVRDAVGRFLHDQHVLRLKAVPRAELDAALAVAAGSRVDPSGPVCEAVPNVLSLVRRRFPDALIAFTHASCEDDGCALSVSVDRPTARGALRGPPVARWRASVTATGDVGGWVAAVNTLSVPQPQSGGVLALLGGTSGPTPRVTVLHTRGIGTWSTQPTVASFASAHSALDACHVRGPSFGDDDLLLAIDASGAITQCESPARDSFTDGARLRCLCDAVRGVTFGAGAADRRVFASVMNVPESGVQSGDRCVRAAVDAITSDDAHVTEAGIGDVTDAVARCAADAQIAAPTRIPATITVSGTGRVTDVAVDEGVAAPLRACVTTALRAARTTCTTTGATASIQVRLRAYAATEACSNFTR